MGGSSYSYSRAESSRTTKSTLTNSINENFKQNIEKKAHAEMKSQGIIVREARDSDVHPNTFPIIFCLDLTGSMQNIPQNLIRTGLPKLISGIIQGGVQSPALMFMGVGDHEWDREPLQIGQFESGDKELDLWLERTYLEGGGGGNSGESYGLAHYFAARHTVTDAWEKRGIKGLLITIGDEPSLTSYPSNVMGEIMGNNNIPAFTDKSILAEAQEKWEVFHINPRDSGVNNWRGTTLYWKDLLGQNYIGTDDYTKIPDIVKDLVLKMNKYTQQSTPEVKEGDTTSSTNTNENQEEIL